MDAYLHRRTSGGMARRPSVSSSTHRSRSQPAPALGSAHSRKRRSSDALPNSHLAQTYIDLGQKSFARIIECAVCGFAYTHGEETDELAHSRHHRRALQGVRVRGALAALHPLGIEQSDGSHLVALSEGDGAEARRKLSEAVTLLDPEFGAKDVPQAFRAVLCLEMATGRVRAFAIAEPLDRAYRAVPQAAQAVTAGSEAPVETEVHGDGVLTHDGESHEAMCGVSHLWVEPEHRRLGLARAMLDALRQRFAAGFVLPLDKLAFSGPTASGRRLAAAYCGTESFLVYD